MAKIVIIEGVDKVGKTAMVRKLYHDCESNLTLVDRGMLSNIVYAKKYNRDVALIEENESLLVDFLEKGRNSVRVLYLYANEDVIKERCIASNEEEYDSKSDRSLFEEEIDKLSLRDFINFYEYDTSEVSADELLIELKRDGFLS